jgi:hypothetical protein
MKLTPFKVVSFLRRNPCLTFSEVARRLGISYHKVKRAATPAGINAMDSHTKRMEAIACLIRLNPGVFHYQLGKKLGLSRPSVSGIASRMGIYRHVPRNPAAMKKRENGILRSLGEGKTFRAAAMDNGCSKNVASRVAKEHGVRRPGCPPFSYTKDEEKRVIRWLLHPSISYPHIAKKVGLKENTILFIASRNGIRRRLPSFYRGEIPHQT